MERPDNFKQLENLINIMQAKTISKIISHSLDLTTFYATMPDLLYFFPFLYSVIIVTDLFSQKESKILKVNMFFYHFHPSFSLEGEFIFSYFIIRSEKGFES